MDGNENKIQLRKGYKTIQIVIKTMITKFYIKIKWNKILREEIEKKIIKKWQNKINSN